MIVPVLTRRTARAAAAAPVAAALGLCLAIMAAPALADGASGAASTDGARWQPRLASGYDVYVHTYNLAEDDTTETVSEAAVTAGLEGRSAHDASHRWSLRGEVSAGTELFRELLDASYRWRPAGEDRLRARLSWYGRQYRQDSDYDLSSDNQEGVAEIRAHPWRRGGLRLDLRGGLRWLDYATSSTLEQDHRELRGAAFLASRGGLERSWRAGLRVASRTYPDSSAIDRDAVAVEASWERNRLAGGDVWLFHRSERREAADPDARPSAWSHWSEARLATPAGRGAVVASLVSELWRYDHEDGAYFDSWRLDTETGYRGGDLLEIQWQGLLTVEHLAAGDSPETYTQVGLRGSLESYAGPFSGLVALELGHRWYRNPADPDLDLLDLDLASDQLLASSDFDYVEVWIMASWTLSAHLAIDVTASYHPERHTEQDDDVALGFGSARLVWRP